MSVCYLVFYRGHAKDAESFLEHYRRVHVPILKRFPRIQGIRLLTPVAWDDPHPVSPGGFSLIAQMRFRSVEDLENALRSEARREAREDFAGFGPFEGEIWHQAMEWEPYDE